MFDDFITWMKETIGRYLFYGAVVFVGIPLAAPPICNFLLKEIAKEMEKEHRRTKLRAEQSFKYLMGESSITSYEMYGR